MLVLAIFALLLIILDSFTSWLKPAHNWLENASWPFYWVTDIPVRFKEWSDDSLTGRSELAAEKERLATEVLVYQGQLQRMAELTAENLRLRNLLNATELLSDNVLVTQLIGVSPDPLSHLISINRGVDDQVFIGQPVIDSYGLMGQVIEVFDSHSRVLLITDSRHALPVKVARNGLRAIAEGIGNYHQITLRHISPTQDIVVGDNLVSSGLGGRFPEGYPVGTVTELKQDAGKNFVEVIIEPAAKVDRSRHLLLVFSGVIELDPGEALSGH
ncbi:MAG: rod shape-determining protein MreC [Gammaproteobacteria bacterium]|nr:MAG: rod shape-determining protein MreC [Gammaproteobacteria bacterium]RLA53020.1 MAG: rod shape-determining protein MreC [Gammaproteobacteria bacterium]